MADKGFKSLREIRTESELSQVGSTTYLPNNPNAYTDVSYIKRQLANDPDFIDLVAANIIGPDEYNEEGGESDVDAGGSDEVA